MNVSGRSDTIINNSATGANMIVATKTKTKTKTMTKTVAKDTPAGPTAPTAYVS